MSKVDPGYNLFWFKWWFISSSNSDKDDGKVNFTAFMAFILLTIAGLN